MHNKDLRSRFKKLAGLNTTQPKMSISKRNIISENRVSELLSSGYSYTDIALMEQTYVPPIDASSLPQDYVNLIKQREQSLNYLNQALPTRQGLNAFMKADGYSQNNPSKGNLSSATLKKYFESLGVDPQTVAQLDFNPATGGSSGSPLSQLQKLFTKGGSDQQIADFLNNNNAFQNVTKGIARQKALSDGNQDVANDLANTFYSDLQNSASEIETFKTTNPLLFDDDPDNDAFGASTDADADVDDSENEVEVDDADNDAEVNTTNNNIEQELQKFDKESLTAKYPNADPAYLDQLINAKNNNQDVSAMTTWLDSNESNRYDQNAFDNDPVNTSPDISTSDGQEATFYDGSEGKDNEKAKEFRTWFNTLDANSPVKKKIENAWKSNDVTKGDLSLGNNSTGNAWTKIAFEVAGDDYKNDMITKNNYVDNREAKASNLQNLQNYNTNSQQLQNNNPFVTTPPANTNTTTTTTTTTSDKSSDGNNQQQNQQQKTSDYVAPEYSDNKNNRRWRQTSIRVDANTNLPVDADFEGETIEIDPDSQRHALKHSTTVDTAGNKVKTGFSTYTDEGKAFLAQNAPHLQPNTKQYDKQMKKYNKKMSKLHIKAQKNQYKQGKKDLKNAYKSAEDQIKLDKKDIKKQLNKKISGTNAYVDSQGNVLPANLYGR